jgi:hypothetical protein
MRPIIVAIALAGATPLAAQDLPTYRKVDHIAQLASEKGCRSAVAALRTTYAVNDASCEPYLLKMSLPPRQTLTFTLDGQRFQLFVVARGTDPRAAAPKPKAEPK